MNKPVHIARQSLGNPVKSQTLSEGVYQKLRGDILSCRLAPGARLQINALSENHNVALSAVREALSRLSAEGMVVAEPQRGFHVSPVSLEDLTDLTMARIEIESLCLARSIGEGDVNWETAVVGALHRLSRTPYWAAEGDRRLSEDWALAHDGFHEALVSACGSRNLTRIREALYQQSERYRQLSVSVVASNRDTEAEHRSIAEAALGRQSARACELLKEHLTLTMNIIIQGFTLKSGSKAR
jgi:DNA-binding GntR family transcriptional regulator